MDVSSECVLNSGKFDLGRNLICLPIKKESITYSEREARPVTKRSFLVVTKRSSTDGDTHWGKKGFSMRN